MIESTKSRARKDARNAKARADRAESANNKGIVNKVVKHRRVDVMRMAQAERRRTKEWLEMEEGLERWLEMQRVIYWRESVPGDRPVYCASDYLNLFKGQFTQRVVIDWRQGWGRVDPSLSPGEYGTMLSYFWGFTPFSELRFIGNPIPERNNDSVYNQRRSVKMSTEKRTRLLRMCNLKCDICGEEKKPRSLIIVSLDEMSGAITDLRCRSCFGKNLPNKKRWRFTKPS